MLHQDAPMKRIDIGQPMKANRIYIPEIFAFEVIKKNYRLVIRMFNGVVSNLLTEKTTKCEYLKFRKKDVVNCRQTRRDTVVEVEGNTREG